MTILANLNRKGLQLGDVASLAHLNDGTLESQLKLFLVTCEVNNLSPRSIEDYAQKIGAFVTFCRTQEIYKLSQVNPSAIRLFLLGTQQRCKPVSVHGYYGTVCRFFNWLVEEGTIKESPMARMHPPKVPKQLIKPFTQDHIDRLLTLCDHNRSSFLGCRDKAIVLTFLDTGLRLSELANIQLQDIDFDRETIKVMGKGAKERLVRLGEHAQKALLRYILQRNDNLDCLWLTEERKPLQARGIQQMIERLGKRAGITNVRCSPHTFRHTFAPWMLKLGADLKTIQSLLGHSTIGQTLRYAESVNSEQAVEVHRRFSPVDNMRRKRG